MIPQIQCKMQNHYQMPFQYICMQPECLRTSKQLCCLYCCQQLHKHSGSLQNIQPLKAVLKNFQIQMIINKRNEKNMQFKAAQILMNGIKKCQSEVQLRHNIGQILGFWKEKGRFQKIIDKDNQIQRQQTRNFYQNRNHVDQNIKTIKKNKKQPLQMDTSFITPILTFSQQDALQQGYQMKSPFCVVNSSQKLVTAFAYPPLTKYHQSIQISLKIQRLTPFWLGIGVSFGRKKYEPQSKDHVMMTSNGWISILGQKSKTDVKYCSKDIVKVKLDKKMNLIQFTANNSRRTIPLQIKWNQDIYLCCVLYYKDDSVLILA